MKIENYVIKILIKIKELSKKIFIENKKSNKMIILILAFILSSDYYYYLSDLGINKFIAIIGVSLIFYILLSLALYLIKFPIIIIKRINTRNLSILLASIFIIYKFLDELNSGNYFSVSLITFVSILIIYLFVKSLYSFLKEKKTISGILLISSGLIIVFACYFITSPGYSEKSGLKYAKIGKLSTSSKVLYNSKSIEYGENLDETIDLTNYVNYSDDITKKVRKEYFKNDLAHVPIKGKIWYPDEIKNSPVLFMVHGNHNFTTSSYEGYDYLGRYLARRGIVTISIDMNILNGFLKFGLNNENDSRAILLLENIKSILSKNKNPKDKLYKLINENEIAIAGHSRGGEACAIAVNFNKLQYNPDNGKSLNYKFNINGIITISSTVDQYNPSDKNLVLENINLLSLQGTHDFDIEGFESLKYYNNTTLNPNSDKFKTAVYIGYTNHGQFNSKWGSCDLDPPNAWFINRSALLNEYEQKNILCIYTHKFLENVFNISKDRGLFINPQNYDLPKTLYYSIYSDDKFKNLVDFEEDYDLTTSKFGKIKFSNFTSIKEKDIDIGGSSTDNTGLYLKSENTAYYKINFDNKENVLKNLQFDIKNNDKTDNLNFNIVLTDENDNKSLINGTKFIKIYPEIKVELSKLEGISDNYEYKGGFQTIRIPLAEFSKNIKLSNKIKTIEFQFIGHNDIALDNIGFSGD